MKINTSFLRSLLAALAPLFFCAGTADAETSPLPFNQKPAQIIKPNGGQAVFSETINLPPFEAFCWFAAEKGRWPADVNRELPWYGGDTLKGLLKTKPNPITSTPGDKGMFALFKLKDGRYAALLPLIGNESFSWLRIDDEGKIHLESGTLGTEQSSLHTPQLSAFISDDIYECCARAWAAALTSPGIKGKTGFRTNKQYPAMFTYLGWCSWEQYKKNISEPLLTDAIRKIEQSPLPIRWVLIDDGFQREKNLRLKSFAPRPDRFPSQWKDVIALKSKKIRWFGLWNDFNGLWNGICGENDFPVALNSGFLKAGDKIFPGGSQQGANEFYKAFMESVKKYGFDFVKIDDQGAYLKNVAGTANPARANGWCSSALEEACRQAGLPLVNCMAQGPVNLFNTKYSAATRCSIDYELGSEAMAKSHLVQSYANTLWLGQSVWPDHDMFHSSDRKCAQMMAISKALSGGPVYLSDDPDHFVAENVMPLVLHDGRILRPLAPAVPLPDSVFADAMNEDKPYRVIAPLPNHAAAIAVYNLKHPSTGTTMTATVKAGDYSHANAMLSPQEKRKLPQEGLAVYDWRTRTGKHLPADGSDGYEITLKGFSDGLVIMAPVQNGWAVIGHPGKFLSPCMIDGNITATAKALSFKLRESGPTVIWMKEGRPVSASGKTVDLGGGFWLIDLPDAPSPAPVSVTRG